MSKKSLTKEQMSDAAYIEQAVAWSKELTRMRTRSPGDTENAMRAVEREYGIDYWFLWRLRYRAHTVKHMSISVYLRLRDAHEAECGRQLRRYQHERTITQASGQVTAALIGAADTLAGTEDGAD